MSGRFNMLLVCFGISALLSANTTDAQILQDSNSVDLVRKEIGYIYNLQFKNANETYEKIARLYPGHPVVFLLHGLSTYWKNYPVFNDTPASSSFEEDMRHCIHLAERNNNAAHEAEFLLANLCARGMLLKFYSDNNMTLASIPLASGTYKYIRRSFNYTSSCSDLYYYTGVYNYYREAYPKVYPAYKPLAALLPSGNMETGLKELNTAAVKAVVMKAESYILLSWIYLNFENKYDKALFFCKSLYEMYPENIVYLSTYVKDLLLMKRYEEAEKRIHVSLNGSENRFLRAQLTIFKGVLLEKKYQDNIQAQQYYISGLSKIAPYGVYGNEFAAYAYFGLSRICYANNDKTNGKRFRQKAMKLGDFKKLNFDN